MITKPQAKEPQRLHPGQTATAAAPKGDKPVAAPAAKALISVEAVEIEGNKIFIAGTAEAGSTVKVYANTDLLGTTKTSPNGRFLVQTVQELAVGDYIIRADMLGKDGVTVVARAAVPFKREAGERIAAVAPDTAATPVTVRRPRLAPLHRRRPDNSRKRAEAPLKMSTVRSSFVAATISGRISRRTYGAGMRYTTIYLANKEQIRNPNMIFPGQVFALPEKDKAVLE